MYNIACILILIAGIVAFPIMATWRSTTINAAFKRIKIKKFSFIFPSLLRALLENVYLILLKSCPQLSI